MTTFYETMSNGSGLEYGGTGVVTAVDGSSAEEWKNREAAAEVKVATLGSDLELRGYATRYYKPHIGKDGVEVFLPGCFARSLSENHTIRFLIAHDEGKCAGTTAGALELHSDAEGLAFRMSVPATSLGAEIKSIAACDHAQMSIGYRVEDDEYRDIAGERVRFIVDATLREISLAPSGKAAVKQTHAALVERSHWPLRELCERKILLSDAAAAAVRREMAAFLDRLTGSG